MINDIINNSLYGEIILMFLGFAYIFMRFAQKKFQKREKLNNMEFWVYYNLVDFYKFNGYPYPEISAKNMIKIIINMKNKECGLKPWIVIIDEAKDFIKAKNEI